MKTSPARLEPGQTRLQTSAPLAAPLLALIVAHMLDYGTFLVLLSRHGLAAERNPIVLRLVHELGLNGLTLTKILVMLLVALSATVLFRRRYTTMAVLVVAFGIGAGLIGALSNIIAL